VRHRRGAVSAVLGRGHPRQPASAARQGDEARLPRDHHRGRDRRPGQRLLHGPPSDPITSEGTYAKDFAAFKAAGRAPALTYARIAREKGHAGFVVRYWFFYYLNEFNDLHEGDWEGIQIAFDAATPAEALAEEPSKIALFQYGGGVGRRQGQDAREPSGRQDEQPQRLDLATTWQRDDLIRRCEHRARQAPIAHRTTRGRGRLPEAGVA
jgi:hypothetical protein